MKRFISRLILFCIAPLVMLIPLGYIVDKGLQQSRYFFYSEWNDLFDGKANADMIILGTSRAWVHFSPRILDSVLGLNTYNLGMDGTPIDMQYERLKVYLRYNRKPKYIIQEVGFNTTLMLSSELPMYQQFLPYLHDSAMWRIYKRLHPKVTIVERYLPLYKYNNQLPVLKEGIWSFFGKGAIGTKYKGYLGQDRVWDSSFSNMVKNNPGGVKPSLVPEAIQLFKDYLAFCNANGIQVIMVYTPFYYEMNRYIINHDAVNAVFREMSATYNVPLLDYTHNYLDSNRAYFYNSQHMNRQGAELFTNMLAQDLKRYIVDTPVRNPVPGIPHPGEEE